MMMLTAPSAVGILAGLKPVTMDYRKLGSSDLMVSSCCLGTMTWGCQNTDEEAAAQLNLAWDMGVNFLDTAEIYPVPVEEAKQGATDPDQQARQTNHHYHLDQSPYLPDRSPLQLEPITRPRKPITVPPSRSQALPAQ